MVLPTVGSYFSGGGIGLAELKGKVDFAFAVEYAPAISEVYRANIGDRILTARVQDVDVSKLETVDLFQVSPVCKNFSAAKTGGKESTEEISQAVAICRYLDYHKPPYFLLENVRGYIKSKSFQMIVVKLSRLGYTMRQSVENSANYGVAQTRERLILRAALNRPLPSLPDYAGRWVGWYEAIEDLIPGLPESKFADWQLELLPDYLKVFLADGTSCTIREPLQPAPTVTAALLNNTAMPRAFLMSSANSSKTTIRVIEEPSMTLETFHKSCKPRAFIVDGKTNDNGRLLTVPNGQEPVFTIASSSGKQASRAWLSQGRVVQMTPRALARFQSIPDWYKLPDKNGLACKIIGNGIPSLMGARIIEAMLGLHKSEVAA